MIASTLLAALAAPAKANDTSKFTCHFFGSGIKSASDCHNELIVKNVGSNSYASHTIEFYEDKGMNDHAENVRQRIRRNIKFIEYVGAGCTKWGWNSGWCSNRLYKLDEIITEDYHVNKSAFLQSAILKL